MIAFRIVLIAHLFGLAFGMGGASTIDAIFLVAARRGRVTRELVEVVHAATGLVVGAMVLLATSGAAFFLVGSQPSPKFWAKMIIVGVACLNGLAAHRIVFPLIEAAAASGAGRLHLRPWDARLAVASAAISGVSWSSALVLGAWHGLKLGMQPILALYLLVLTGGLLVSTIVVAPRVFVFAPNGSRRRSPRDVPAEIAYSLALVIADGALAIAGRLRATGRWSEPERDPFAAPAFGPVTTVDTFDGRSAEWTHVSGECRPEGLFGNEGGSRVDQRKRPVRDADRLEWGWQEEPAMPLSTDPGVAFSPEHSW